MPGRIAVVAVREGQTVNRGALLVQLEDAPEQAALQAAEADYEKAMHGQSRSSTSARARAVLSADAFRRTQEAAKGGAATVDDLDKARRHAEIDRRAYEASEQRAKAMVAGSRYEDIAAARTAPGRKS